MGLERGAAPAPVPNVPEGPRLGECVGLGVLPGAPWPDSECAVMDNEEQKSKKGGVERLL